MAQKHMLTTMDNPYNPFTHFDEWYAFDEGAGYHSSGLLARFARTSEELSDADRALAIETAIEEIISENIPGNYRKVSQDSEENVGN